LQHCCRINVILNALVSVSIEIFSKMKKYLFLFTVLLSVLMFSCKTDQDQQAPLIEYLSVSPNFSSDSICGEFRENSVIRIYIGDSLKLGLGFSDDMGLSQYKIDIHNDFDCHDHKAILLNPWQFLEIIDLQGKEAFVNKSIPIPSNISAGNYHFQVMLLDESGNEAGTTESYTLKIVNPDDSIVPVLNMVNPNSSSVTANRGQVVNFSGTMSDNLPLDGGKLELVYFTTSGLKVVAQTINFDASMGSSYNFNINYSIPNSLSVGNYIFELRAFDGAGNSSYGPEIEVQLN
jgi:hypothetical protein